MFVRREETSDSLVFTAYFADSTRLAEWMHLALQSLSPVLRPTRFGQGEIPRSPGSIDDEAAFGRHLEKHGGSVWLYGRRIKYNLSPFDRIPSEVYAWTSVSDETIWSRFDELVDLWDGAQALYGFGAAFDEHRDRNGYVLPLASGGRAEGWFGRCIARYIPGVYWLNYFSDEYLAQRGVRIHTLESAVGGRLRRLGRGALLLVFDRPEQWPQHAERINRTLASIPGVFSRTAVELPARALEHREHFEWGQELHKQWP